MNPDAPPNINLNTALENAVTFGTQAETYAAARPQYPQALFDWIAAEVPGHNLVWDVGTGSGQAALSLAERFSRVYATDLDAAQIAQAPKHDRIEFVQAQAHMSGLDESCAAAITVATALHWFDFEKFWPEVRRVARPGAIFCAWTYHRAEADEDVTVHFLDPVLDILKPYWSEGNRISWRGYIQADVQMPFERLSAPETACELSWTPQQIAAYVTSWSAHKKARMDGHAEILDRIERQALEKLSDTPRLLRLPLHILAARID